MKSALTALALAATITTGHSFPYAAHVAHYNPGTGFSTEFGTGLGYTNSVAALGEPARITPGEFGGAVDPFNPPYLRDQIVSLGTGGSLTVEFGAPVIDQPENVYGLDFLIFGNSGLILDFGTGRATGELFAHSQGQTRVSVSPDGVTFYELDSSLAPVVDRVFPTDGAGNFQLPVNPALNPSSFAGKNLSEVRAIYGGSGGGAGYDLSWARDAQGAPVQVGSVRFVRVDVLSGVAEIDGFSAVPEPSALTLLVLGGLLCFRRKRP